MPKLTKLGLVNCYCAGLSEDTNPSAEEILLDMIMLRLRLADGLNMSKVAADFGDNSASAIFKAVKKHQEQGFVQHDGEVIRLRDPEGFLFSNDIISDIFAALDSN